MNILVGEDPEDCPEYDTKIENDKELILEDWKMTKSLIKHFDDIIIRIRLQGIPIATGLQVAALALSDRLSQIDSPLPVFSLIMLASILYIIPIFLLDIFHFKLLANSVKHAGCLEKKYFNGKISITQKLTTKYLYNLNKIGGFLIYAIIIGVGIFFAIYGFIFPSILENTPTS